MLKLLVKLAIVALLANAAYRIGSEYLTYVKFRDAVRDAAMFKAKNDDELTARIMDLAAQYDVPLDEDNIAIHAGRAAGQWSRAGTTSRSRSCRATSTRGTSGCRSTS